MRQTGMIVSVVLMPCLGTSACGRTDLGALGGGMAEDAPAAKLCPPGADKLCYSGPPGTQEVGVCKAGITICPADGTGWGPCDGEVIPTPENCATAEDENCDGYAPHCGIVPRWIKTFGGPLLNEVGAMAVERDGSIIITGHQWDAPPAVYSSEIFVTKLDSAGNILWDLQLGDTEHYWEVARSVAVDAMGNVVVPGNFTGTMDFGGGPLMSPMKAAFFLASFDAMGAHRWSKTFGQSGVYPYSVATDANGNVLLAATGQQDVDFGGGVITAENEDVFLVKFDSMGNHVWSTHFGDAAADQRAKSIALDADANIIIAGEFEVSLDIGGTVFTSQDRDAFVAKFDPSGNPLWSRQLGGPQEQYVRGVAVDTAGDVVVGGSFFGSIDLGGGVLTSAGEGDLFIAKLDSSGNHLWSRRFGNADSEGGDDYPGRAVAVDQARNIVWSGGFFGVLDLGGTPLGSTNGGNAFLAKLDPAGNHLWSTYFETNGAMGVGTDMAGNVAAVGYFAGVGEGLEGDVFAVKLGP